MIKVSLIVTCGLLAAYLLRKQSAALRHWVLAAALMCAAGVPLLERIVPAWQVVAPISSPVAQVQQAIAGLADRVESRPPTPRPQPEARATAHQQRLDVTGMLGAIWIAGAAGGLLVLIVGLGRLRYLASGARHVRHGRWVDQASRLAHCYGIRRPLVILQSAHPTLLMTWGLLRPRVLLPCGAQDWPEERIRIVLAHELAHIRRGDWAAQIAAEVLRAVYWFNPLIWIASARLRRESEQACDDAVLNLGVEGQTYAAHLLDLARAAATYRRTGVPAFPAPAMVRPSSLERRVTAMLNAGVNRHPTTRRTRVAATLTIMAAAMLIAGFGAAAQRFAKFSGAIFDPHNGTVPQVTVVLTHTQSDAKYEVKSDQSGRFEFPALPAGDYRLEAKYPGFMTFSGTVTVGTEDVQKNVALQLGTLEETITIRSTPGTPVTDTENVTRSAAPRNQASCTPAPNGGNIRPPRRLVDVRPRYPQHLADTGIAGVVNLEARIGPDGNVADVHVVDAAHPDLGTAAMDAVRQWQFDSTLLNCVPVDVKMNVRINFELEK